MPQNALIEMREQLRYWQDQLVVAQRAGRDERAALCERFIAQCQRVIAALENSLRGAQKGH